MEFPGDRPLLRTGELARRDGQRRHGAFRQQRPRPDLVVLAATVPESLEPLRPQLGSLARRAPLALARAGATAQIATAMGAQLLAGDPVTEAGQARWPR